MLFVKRPTIVTEAEKKITITPDNDTSDYTEDVDPDPDADTTDTEEDVAPDDTEDTPEEDTPEEDTTDEEDDTTDYTDENDDKVTDSDMPTEDAPTDTRPNLDAKKNAALLKDFISLYDVIISTMDRLSDIKKGDLLISSILIQVIKNLSTTEKQIFNYIHSAFSKNTYVSNLYQYNYFIEALKINIEMMKKIKNLDKV